MKLTIDIKDISPATKDALLADAFGRVVPAAPIVVASTGAKTGGRKPRKAAPKAKKAAKADGIKTKTPAAKKARAKRGATDDSQVLAALANEASVADIAAKLGVKKPHVAAALKRLRKAGKAYMAGSKRFARWGLSASLAEARAEVAKLPVAGNGKAPKAKAPKRARKASSLNGAASATVQ